MYAKDSLLNSNSYGAAVACCNRLHHDPGWKYCPGATPGISNSNTNIGG